MSLRRPAVELTLDGRSLDAAESALLRLQVELSVGGGHDRFVCQLGLLSPFAGVAPGADAELKLGYGDDLEAVLSGTVSAVERASWGLVVEGLAGTAKLSESRVGRSYVDQTAADIVTDLVSGAGAATGEVSAPRRLSAYHVDERRSVWTHVRQLARLTGSELTSDPQGALNFRPVRTGAADHGLRHGADLLAWKVGPRDAGEPGVAVVPYGAASEEGADKWHILLREPEGSSPGGPVLVPAALRDRDSAEALAEAIAGATARGGAGGSVVVVGDGSIRAGDLVELEELPDDGLPLLRATSVTHLLGGDTAFRTALAVEAAA